MININLQQREAIKNAMTDKDQEQVIDNIQDLVRHQNLRASQSANMDLIATMLENEWLDMDYALSEVLDYLSIENEELLEELEKGAKDGWFDYTKLAEVRDSLAY